MASMTPTRPTSRRRMTSPLLEMDGVEEQVPETPVSDELGEVGMDPTMNTATLAEIVRNEIHHGLGPLQVQMANLSTNVTNRLSEIEGVVREQDSRILKLEKLLETHGSNSSTPRSEKIVEHEKLLADLKAKLESLKFTPPDPQTDVSRTMVIGGLEALGSLQESTTWLSNKLPEFGCPCHVGTYIKSTAFEGLMFAKFRSSDARDTAVASLRSAKLRIGNADVWATQDLPIPVRARKLFLLRLRWQLGQWGFVKREMVVDDEYTTLSIANKVIVKVSSQGQNLQVEWADEWAQWQEFQESAELKDMSDKSHAILKKEGKGGGKSKSAATVH